MPEDKMQEVWERAEAAIDQLEKLAEGGRPGAAKLMRLVAEFRSLANDLSGREGTEVLDCYMHTIDMMVELWAAAPPVASLPDHFVDRARTLCADLMELTVAEDDGRYDGQRIDALRAEARSLLTGEPRGS